MNKRDELIEIYAGELRNKCGQAPDMDLLSRVTIGLGPAIYNPDACTVAGTDPKELDRIRRNFLMKRLGLPDGPDLVDGLDHVIEAYGRSNRAKHRAVVYYLLTRHFGREAAYRSANEGERARAAP